MLIVCPSCQHAFRSDFGSVPQNYGLSTSQQEDAGDPLFSTSTFSLPIPCLASLDCRINVTITGKKSSAIRHDLCRNTLSGGTLITTTPRATHSLSCSSSSGSECSLSEECCFSGTDFPALSVSLAKKKRHKLLSKELLGSELALCRLSRSLKYLRHCGWYHRGLSWKDAIELLMPCDVGTFLLRDSSDSRFLYSLSVQTKCGPTSIRIYYSAQGEFRLDADEQVARTLPTFHCVLQLVQYYVDATTKHRPLQCSHNELDDQVWVDKVGAPVRSHITLRKPLWVNSQVSSLKHLCRLTLNRYLNNVSSPCCSVFVQKDKENVSPPSAAGEETFQFIPPAVRQYLLEYPYKY